MTEQPTLYYLLPEDVFEAALCGLSLFITDRARFAGKGVYPEIKAAHRTMSIMSAVGPEIRSDEAQSEADDLIGVKAAASLLGCGERHARRLLKEVRPTGVDGVYRRRSVIEILEERNRQKGNRAG